MADPQTGTLSVAKREAALIDQAIAGDEEAFTQLYDHHYDRVVRFIASRIGSAQDAEDLTQQVFLQAWKALHRYQHTDASFLSWLLTIAHNLAVNYLQRHKIAHPLKYDVPERRANADPEYVAEVHGEQARVREAVGRLKPDQQQAITLRYLEDRAYRDIAAAMSKTEVHVRVICRRALLRLRLLLEQEDQECSRVA